MNAGETTAAARNNLQAGSAPERQSDDAERDAVNREERNRSGGNCRRRMIQWQSV